MYGPRVQFGDSWLDSARPIYPTHSTRKQDCQSPSKQDHDACRASLLIIAQKRLTETSHGQGDEEPRPRSNQLVQMQKRSKDKYDDENNGCHERWVIAVGFPGNVVGHFEYSC